MATFELSIMTPDRLVFSEPAIQVDLPGEDGDFGVLAGHAPVIALLRPGLVTVTGDGFAERFVVIGGIAEIVGATLTVLAEFAVPVEDFDPDEFQARIDEMQEALADLPDDEDPAGVTARLDQFRAVLAAVSLITLP